MFASALLQSALRNSAVDFQAEATGSISIGLVVEAGRCGVDHRAVGFRTGSSPPYQLD